MDSFNKIKITINGNDYVLKSNQTPERMQEIAKFVDKKIEELGARDLRFNKTMQATLACINISDLLYKEIETNNGLKEEIDSLKGRNKELAESERSLQDELKKEKEASRDREIDLKALRQNLIESQEKLLAISKQFQEYQRSHK